MKKPRTVIKDLRSDLEPILRRPGMFCGLEPVRLIWIIEGFVLQAMKLNPELMSFVSFLAEHHKASSIDVIERQLAKKKDKLKACKLVCTQARDFLEQHLASRE